MFVPTFYLAGRYAVNAGKVSLEGDPFGLLLMASAYQPDDAHASANEIAPLEAVGDGYTPGGIALPPMGLTPDPQSREIMWGAGVQPSVFPNVTIRDFGWAVGYHMATRTLMFYADLGRQSVSEVDVTLRWSDQGIGVERLVQ